ncbi:unnamed protein product [Adineta steineri]|uniref:Uncharacterized protein n=1 Tax=Adineta steineri TaxID=433720 RepID=A0A819VEY6_9BILA|nr:unnamed protein product [Adineta steineri]CAF4108168.1 unnamed protein product [Adineta steineri]
MPINTTFCSKWLQKPDNTDRVSSRWLKQGKTTSSFQCLECSLCDLNYVNGGWDDVFGSIPLTASNNQSLLLSKNKDDNETYITTGSIDGSATRIPKYLQLLFTLKEKEIELLDQQKILQQDLVSATKMLEEGSTQLATIVNSKDFNDAGTGELLITAANVKLSILKAQLLENSEN